MINIFLNIFPYINNTTITRTGVCDSYLYCMGTGRRSIVLAHSPQSVDLGSGCANAWISLQQNHKS